MVIAESLRTKHLVRITHLRNDLEPGWNGEGSVPPTEAAAETARLLTERLPDEDLNGLFIVPTSEGGYGFEWDEYDPGEGEPKQAGHLEVSPDGTFKFYTFQW